jgi:hypothetical protein
VTRLHLIALAGCSLVLAAAVALEVHREPRCEAIAARMRASDNFCESAQYRYMSLRIELRDIPSESTFELVDLLLGPDARNRIAACTARPLDFSRYDDCSRRADTPCLGELAEQVEAAIRGDRDGR